jgi:hypothetical protein
MAWSRSPSPARRPLRARRHHRAVPRGRRPLSRCRRRHPHQAEPIMRPRRLERCRRLRPHRGRRHQEVSPRRLVERCRRRTSQRRRPQPLSAAGSHHHLRPRHWLGADSISTRPPSAARRRHCRRRRANHRAKKPNRRTGLGRGQRKCRLGPSTPTRSSPTAAQRRRRSGQCLSSTRPPPWPGAAGRSTRTGSRRRRSNRGLLCRRRSGASRPMSHCSAFRATRPTWAGSTPAAAAGRTSINSTTRPWRCSRTPTKSCRRSRRGRNPGTRSPCRAARGRTPATGVPRTRPPPCSGDTRAGLVAVRATSPSPSRCTRHDHPPLIHFLSARHGRSILHPDPALDAKREPCFVCRLAETSPKKKDCVTAALYQPLQSEYEQPTLPPLAPPVSSAFVEMTTEEEHMRRSDGWCCWFDCSCRCCRWRQCDCCRCSCPSARERLVSVRVAGPGADHHHQYSGAGMALRRAFGFKPHLHSSQRERKRVGCWPGCSPQHSLSPVQIVRVLSLLFDSLLDLSFCFGLLGAYRRTEIRVLSPPPFTTSSQPI